jgi:signal transduction histidine kinase/ActR/RegA family two-component response regulator
MAQEPSQSSMVGSVLGQRIFLRSLLSIGVTCVLVMAVQAVLVVQLMQEQRLRTMETTVDLMLPNLANAAWQINEANARALLQTLMAQSGIREASFRDETMQLAIPDVPDAEVPACDKEIRRSLTGMNVGSERLMSGELRLCWVSPDNTVDLLPWAMLTSLPLLLVVVLAAISPARLLNRMVIRPIAQITHVLRQGLSIMDLRLVRPKADQGDEIDQLVAEIKQRTVRFMQEKGVADKAFDALNDGLAITDPNQRVLRVNAALKRLLPKGADIGEGDSLADYVPAQALRTFDRPFEFEAGSGRTLEASASPLFLPGQGQSHVYLFRDLSLKKQLEATVQQSHKMNALGSLSSGVAHDFNNLLMTIGGNAELVSELEKLSPEGKDMVQSIRVAARRGAVLTSQLLSYARKQHLKAKQLWPREVVGEVVELARRTLGSTHSVALDVQATRVVHTDATFLETALLNLMVNARDAQIDGGAIRVVVQDVHQARRDWVSFAVINTGPTIPRDVLARMGEPFFTTKAKGRGTGLGLSMVMGFAEQSGGHVTIESNDGVTRIAIVLPGSQAEAPLSRTAPTFHMTNLPPRALRVLVVDDDAVVLQVLGRMLKTLGHEVDRAFTPSDVRGLIQQNTRWDVVLCDMVLERANGFDVHALIEPLQPAPVFFFISGNIPPALADRLPELPHVRILQKPIELDALQQVLDDAMRDEVPA